MNTDTHICPQCGRNLKTLIRAYTEDEPPISSGSIHMGDVCSGDDRDGIFMCESCKTVFSAECEPIKLINCPLEASNSILSVNAGNMIFCIAGQVSS